MRDAPVMEPPPRRHRGGNKLPPGHPARGRPPKYERRWSWDGWGPDPERRDRNQRTRARRAVALAQGRGLLTPLLASVLYALYDASDERLNVTWWGEAYIARLVNGSGHYGDNEAGARTAGAWMAELKKLGWAQAIQRMVVVEGRLRFTTNAWRLVIPPALRSEVEAREDAARAKSSARWAHPGRVTPRAQSRPPVLSPHVATGHHDAPSPAGPNEPSADVEAQIAASRAALANAVKRAPPNTERPPRR